MNVGELFAQTAAEVRRKSGIPDPPSREEASRSAFQDANKEILAAVENLPEAANRLRAYIRIHSVEMFDELGVTGRPATASEMLAVANASLLALIDKQAITLAVETTESRAALENLKRSVEQSGLRPPATLPPQVATAEAEVVDPYAEVVADFKNLGSGDFRRKWNHPEKIGIYEAAVTAGRI